MPRSPEPFFGFALLLLGAAAAGSPVEAELAFLLGSTGVHLMFPRGQAQRVAGFLL